MKRVRSKARRYLAAALALMLCLSLLPMSAMATDDTASDWTISYNKTTGTAIASKYSGSATVITVPSSTKDLDGNVYPVTEVDAIMVNDTAREAAVTSITIPASVTTIKKIAFQNCTGLQTVTFESGSKLTTIGESAFNGCTALQNIDIPSGVTSIGESAFNGCTSLTNVTFAGTNTLTTLGSSAFRGCAKLASINLPSTVTDIQMYAFYGDTSLTNINLAGAASIGMYAFLGCKNLADVTLGNNLTSIGINAFNGCPITAIALPDTLTTIGASAFSGCKLQSVTIPAKVTEIGNYAFYGNTALTSLTINNAAASVGNYVFEGCTALASANLGTGVTSIGESAFSGDAALTSITIPASVTALGKEAFYNCSALATLTVNDAPVDIGSNAFKGCTNLTSVSLGAKLTGIGTRAFIDCTKLAGTVTIPATVKTLGEYAFYGCTSLTGAVINATAAIGDNAFSGCTALTSLTLGSGVTAIGEGAFSGCAAVKEYLTIPDSVTTIGASAFSKCSGLTGVTLPANLTSLGEDAFYQCTDLAGTVTIPSGVTMIPKSAFTSCEALSGVVLQGDVTEIGAYAFSGCTALTSCPLPDTVKVIDAYAFSSAGITSIALPANLESIGISAFSGTRFTSIIIPSKVTAIADHTFFSCTNLETVKLPDGLKTIDDYAFSSCGKLASVNLPSKLSKIGQEALSNCTSLPSVVIPDSVTTIGQEAFENCTSLKSATISKSVTSIAYATFGCCTSLPSITIPEGVTLIDRNAFGMCTNLTKVTLPSTLKSIYAKAFDRAAYANGAFKAHSVDYRGTAAQWAALQTWDATAQTGINWDKTVSKDFGNTGNDYLKNDITLTTDVKPAYNGTLAAAPTVASKSGGSVTLNAVTVTDESVEYGYSAAAAAAPAIWQDAVDFTNVPAGDNYFFARVKETSTHLAGGMSAASAPVTVYAKPTVSYGTMDTLVIGTAIADMDPTAAVPAGAAESNPYTLTGTLPAGLTFNTSTGIISGTPTAYAAVGGSVTVTVTDKESIVSDPYTVNYGPVAKTANTMTSVTQADVAYNGTASLVSQTAASNGNTPVFTYKAQGADDSTYSSAVPTQAGAYTVKATSSGSATVADASVTANFNITPITLTGSDLEYTGTVTKVYDGTTSCALTSVGVKSSSLKTGDAAMTVSGTAVYDSKDVSAAKVTFTPSAITTGNYRLAAAETLDINAAITAFTAVTDNTNKTQAVVKGDGSFAVPAFAGTNSESATGTIAYTYGGEAKTYDEIKTALAALNSGDTASISYTFTGNGNYTGASVDGTINAAIVDIAFTVGTAAATETNAVTKAASPTYGMTWAQLVSINSGSITAKVGANAVAGTYSLDVSGTPDAGNKTFKVLFNGALGGVTYTDVTVCTGSITVAPKAAALTVSAIPAQPYTGSAIEPAVTVKDGDKTLTLTTDYTVSYKNNTDAGTAEVTVAGAGNYAGSTGSASFTISPKAIAESNFTALTTAAGTYTGSPVTQNIASASLKQGTDYTVAYTNNTNAGTASYTVAGAGNYTGSITRSFTIAPKAITVIPNAGLTKTYGAADPALTYTASGLVGNDKVTGTLKRAAGEYVGTYSINDISGLTAGGNYALRLDSTPVNFTITQAAYVLTGIPATLYIGSTFSADTIKNAVKGAGAVTIASVAVQKPDGTAVTGKEADAIATVDAASNAVTAKGAGKVVVTYSIAANDLGGTKDDEYAASGSQTVTLTLTSAPYSGGSGAAAAGVTVPASSDAGSVKVSAKVADNTATIAPTDAQIAAVASASKETGTVVIDLSSLDVDAAVVPEKLVSAAQKADKSQGLAVVLPAGKVELDKTALNAAANKGDIKLSVQTVPESKLTETQKNVLGSQSGTALVVDVDLLANGVKLTEFSGGQLTVSVPYTLKAGEDASRLVVWFIKDDGTLECRAASYDAKTASVTFTTTHLSRYIVAEFPFTDVPSDSYYYTAAAWAVNNGITGGKASGIFAPSDTCTRAQVVTFLWRAMGSPEPSSTVCPFADVNSNAYYYKAVLWAVEKGITKGTTDTTFSPDAAVSRAQTVTFQWRAAGSPASTAANPFVDVASDAYYAGAVAWAVSGKITGGTTATTFSPANPCTRAQIVTFLWRQLDK